MSQDHAVLPSTLSARENRKTLQKQGRNHERLAYRPIGQQRPLFHNNCETAPS